MKNILPTLGLNTQTSMKQTDGLHIVTELQSIWNDVTELAEVNSLIDVHSCFPCEYDGPFAKHHRWSPTDIGKSFVGVEYYSDEPTGVVFVATLKHIFSESVIQFEIDWMIECSGSGSYYTFWLEESELSVPGFILDGENPILPVMADRICDIVKSDASWEKMRIYMALQAWALAPAPMVI